MRGIHADHDKERFFRVTLVLVITQVGNDLFGFVKRRPFFRVMTFSVCIPIMRVLMLIECTVRVPVVKSMTTLFRCIGIPYRAFGFYILSRIFRIIGSREIRMQFTKIGTVITVFAEYVAHTFHIYAK